MAATQGVAAYSVTSETNLIVVGIWLDLSYLQKLQQRPALFTPGQALFWADLHISGQTLVAPVDPKSNAARATASSLRPQTAARFGHGRRRVHDVGDHATDVAVRLATNLYPGTPTPAWGAGFPESPLSTE